MPAYLVTGATGRQGGAVVKYLLEAGVTVHATVRDKSSAKAKELAAKGVVLFEGTHDEPDEVFRAAATGVTGLFLNVTIFEPGKAKAQAEAIIKAAKAGAGSTLISIVLSSTMRTDEIAQNLALPAAVHPWLGDYYAAKAEVEAVVRGSGIKNYTILRPPVLDYDYLLPTSDWSHGHPDLPRRGIATTSLDDGVTMPYLDEGDIGKVTTATLLDPEKYNGLESEIAADNLTGQQVRDIIASVSGLDIKFHKRTAQEQEETKNTLFYQSFEQMANRSPRTVDLSLIEKKYGIKLTTFAEYLERNKEDLLNSLPPKSLPFVGKDQW